MPGVAARKLEAPRERPILFSAPLVRAILEGRKTQTRRVVTRGTSTTDGTPFEDLDFGRAHVEPPSLFCVDAHYLKASHREADADTRHRVMPRIRTGDRLWVRETFAVMWNQEHPCECYPRPAALCPTHEHLEYRADTGNALPGEWPEDMRCDPECPRWRPSIHMPRWASRIDLDVTDVRVERLQAITDEDAIAEGIERSPNGHPEHIRFAELWDGINGDREGYSWAADPWVWVVSFRRVRP